MFVCVERIEKKVPRAHAEAITTVAWSGDGALLATGSYDGLVHLWDARTFRCLRTIADDDVAPVAAVHFTPNCKFILVSSLDGSIRLWSIPGKLGASYAAAQNAAIAAAAAAVPSLNQESSTTGNATTTLASSIPVLMKCYAGHIAGRFCCPVRLYADVAGSGEVYVIGGSEDGRVFAWNSNTRVAVAVEQAFVPESAGSGWPVPVIALDVAEGNLIVAGLDEHEEQVHLAHYRIQ